MPKGPQVFVAGQPASEHCEWQILATTDGTNYDVTPFYVGSIDKDSASICERDPDLPRAD